MSVFAYVPWKLCSATPTMVAGCAIEADLPADNTGVAAEPLLPVRVPKHQRDGSVRRLAFPGANSRPAAGLIPRAEK